MQIEMFPEDNTAFEAEAMIQQGRVGAIRFAATATSYPIVRRVLTALVSADDEPHAALASRG